ncbi:MAG TPA: tetratricopeptide repeat protein [Burkholderiaceae bacterium]
MAYDHEEQEQLESIKAWWKQYGNLITSVLTAGLVAYAAYNGWNYYQRSQSAEASALFDTMQKYDTAKDNGKVARAALDIEEKYGSTAYAPMAALIAARSAYDANDIKNAKAQLNWVVANSKLPEYKALAQIRLAGILLDEKAYDEALKQLAGDFPEQFASLAHDRRGDILVAQNKLADARTAYVTAITKSDANNPGRQLIQLKLEAIGGTAPAPTPAAAPAKAA